MPPKIGNKKPRKSELKSLVQKFWIEQWRFRNWIKTVLKIPENRHLNPQFQIFFLESVKLPKIGNKNSLQKRNSIS